ncbi:MAG: hypothetical protein N4A72_10950 [Bacteroidales bacterium]|jgi:hypothetical protein|nr:hypothetical protein [Bacteroidales bacterium]
MRKLKLTLKKEIISDLEAKEIKGGANTLDQCQTQGASCLTNCEIDTCIDCFMTNGCESVPCTKADCL